MGMFAHRAIETVDEAQRRAKKLLPHDVYTALEAGSDGGATMKENLRAFEEIGMIPRIGAAIPTRLDLSATFMGQPIDLPVVIAPAAAQAMHPDAEIGVARAAQRAGTAIGLSNFASVAIEEVTRENSKSFAHVYWSGGRDVVADRIERFRQAGVKGLIFTLDLSGGRVAYQPRDWGSPVYPDRLNFAALLRYAPMAIGNPSWFLRYAKRRVIPGLNAPNMSRRGGPVPTLVGGLYEWMDTAIPTWEDVAWLRELWGGPFMVKGLVAADDARRAVDAGATAVGVSNHGGNNLDTTPSPLRFLPSVVRAVGDQVEVTLDSGVRRGTDVLKALALGASSVMIGRPWFYGLAADGERGVYEVLETFRGTIERALVGLGKSSIRDVTVDDLVIPNGFILDPAPESARASRAVAQEK
ncbi:pre-mycofactocin synthase MftD [Microbacterium lacus]|uniref:pre-mycofactocin synthase MftD n=1 Tax=Microbacterium lacus TaxID=415217 RepID=UPI001E29CC4B|nr:pre-mycofactocin synthase MftD [Microbacterium lacus]